MAHPMYGRVDGKGGILTPHRVTALQILHRNGTLTLRQGAFRSDHAEGFGPHPQVTPLVIADLYREGLVDVAEVPRAIGQPRVKIATLTSAGRAIIETLNAERTLEAAE